MLCLIQTRESIYTMMCHSVFRTRYDDADGLFILAANGMTFFIAMSVEQAETYCFKAYQQQRIDVSMFSAAII